MQKDSSAVDKMSYLVTIGKESTHIGICYCTKENGANKEEWTKKHAQTQRENACEQCTQEGLERKQ